MDVRILAVRERVVDGEVSVRKRVHVVINKLLVAINTAGSRGIGIVVNVVGGDYFVNSAEIFAVPDIFENTAREFCILCGHKRSS